MAAHTLSGSESDNVSPVTSAQNAADYLTAVGDRSATTGLPSGTAGMQELVTKAYDLAAWPSLRDELLFDQFASIRPTNLSHNGASVQFNFVDDLPDDPDSAKLSELYDVLPTPMKAYPFDVTMWEYGRVVTTTALLSATSMIPISPMVAERVGRSAGSTIDRLALKALESAGGIKKDGTPGAAPVDVGVDDSPSGTLRKAAETFRRANVRPFAGGAYAAVITPEEETALRAEADVAGWRYWQAQGGNGTPFLSNRAIGRYEGFDIFVSNRVSQGLFIGAEALAKVFSTAEGYGAQPTIVVSPQVDRLRRFASIGWKHLVGYSRFRAEAILTADLAATAAP